jgi:hypothetical protein
MTSIFDTDDNTNVYVKGCYNILFEGKTTVKSCIIKHPIKCRYCTECISYCRLFGDYYDYTNYFVKEDDILHVETYHKKDLNELAGLNPDTECDWKCLDIDVIQYEPTTSSSLSNCETSLSAL